MKKTACIVGVALWFTGVSCDNKGEDAIDNNNHQQVEGFADHHTAENSLDIIGVYTGTVPGDISVELTLDSMSVYTKVTSVKTGKEIKRTTVNGSWAIKENTVMLYGADSKVVARYFAGENFLQVTNENGEKISGYNGESHMLNKQTGETDQ